MSIEIAKYMNQTKLNKQEKAAQFVDRGVESTARSEVREKCIICDQTIPGGEKYSCINGSKYAHGSCVTANATGTAKERKVITHRMVEEVAMKKSAQLSVAKPAKPGRKAKSATVAKTAATKKSKLKSKK